MEGRGHDCRRYDSHGSYSKPEGWIAGMPFLNMVNLADGIGDYRHLCTPRSWRRWQETMSALL